MASFFLKNSNILSWKPTFCSGLCSLGTRLKWNQFLESKIVQWNHRQEATVFFPKCIFIDTDGTREWHIFKMHFDFKKTKHFTTQKLKWRIRYKIASSCMYDNLRLSYYVILYIHIIPAPLSYNSKISSWGERLRTVN